MATAIRASGSRDGRHPADARREVARTGTATDPIRRFLFNVLAMVAEFVADLMTRLLEGWYEYGIGRFPRTRWRVWGRRLAGDVKQSPAAEGGTPLTPRSSFV